MLPLWLEIRDGRIEEVPERAKVVRKIFDLKIQGLGKRLIAKALNKDFVTPFGKSEKWIPSYVHKILTNRAVVGEVQFYRKEKEGRVKEGNVIKDYYPQTISWDLWNRAQLKLAAGRHAGSTGNTTRLKVSMEYFQRYCIQRTRKETLF